MTGGSGMMHMGRMVHVESEVNSDLPSSDATSSPGNPGITREQKLISPTILYPDWSLTEFNIMIRRGI